MKKLLIIIIMILNSPILLFAQYSVFNGKIGNMTIRLFLYKYSDNYVIGVYSYDKYNNPIKFNGNLSHDSLILYENCNWNKYNAIIRFTDFKTNNGINVGKWINQNKKEELKVTLNNGFSFDYDYNLFDSLEVMQENSTKEDYFMALVSNSGLTPSVFGIKIYSKKESKLKQTIFLDSEVDLRMFCNVSVADYNNDSVEDFAVLVPDNLGENPTGKCFINQGKKYIGENCSPEK